MLGLEAIKYPCYLLLAFDSSKNQKAWSHCKGGGQLNHLLMQKFPLKISVTRFVEISPLWHKLNGPARICIFVNSGNTTNQKISID